MSDPLLVVEDLQKHFGSSSFMGGRPVKAVDGVSFTIDRGETLGLVGESGCGKTTLGRTILGLEESTAGTVRFDGTDVTDLSSDEQTEWRREAQIVFQDPDASLNDRMTVGEIVQDPLDVHDWKSPAERRHRVRNLLRTVGLREEHYYRYPHQFSGGQKQRVGIARALALEPEFIVLDEPVSALDVSVQAKILNLLDDLQEKFGLTYLFIAHDLSVVRHVCDRTAVMYLGNIMELGPTDQVFENPANPYTHSLLSAIPDPDPFTDGDRITLRGTLPSPKDPPAGCPFSTRCPMRIRPDEFADLPREVWYGIDTFRDVVHRRDTLDRSISERLREALGLREGLTSVTDVLAELLAEHDVPPAVREELDEAAQLADSGDTQAASNRLAEAFGSECDTEMPANHAVGDAGRASRCHRHRDEHESPDEIVEDLERS